MADFQREIDLDRLWPTMLDEARAAADQFPLLAAFYRRQLIDRSDLGDALAHILAERLADRSDGVDQWHGFIAEIMGQSPAIVDAALEDLLCQLRSNASIKDHFSPLLYFGGFQALQCYRVAHHCWHNDQQQMASYIQGQMVTQFGVDIHPAARIGRGIFIDHAVAIVIGETAVIEDGVTMFQSVTLGGTGKGSGERHPKVRRGAFIGSGAVILGNIEIGAGAKIAGGAVVVKDVPPGTTALGQTATVR